MKRSKPSGSGRGSRLRLTILLATVAALLLVPVAQAAAAELHVKLAGAGSGEVSSVGGHPGTEGFGQGTPPIECHGAPPGEGVCNNTMESFFGATGYGWMRSIAAPGSEFVGWTVEVAEILEGCGEGPECFVRTETEAKVTATFEKEPGFLLTVEKIGTGEGTVVSNPAGIECGSKCAKSFEGKVTLTANPASGSVFTSWTGCVKTTEGTGAKGRTCTVEMNVARTVKAKFTKVQAVTANKDSGGNGFGTVSSSPGGIACGPACTQATAVFTEGSTVTLKAAAVASTSVFAGWSTCEGTEEGNLCKVVASAAKSATAKFNLIPQFALTVTKSGFGTGTVSSSPAGISCGPTCTLTAASYNENKEVTLKAVAATGSEFGGWEGACSGTGTCTVKMEAAKEVTAEFK